MVRPIHDHIRSRRTELDISQAELAERCGLDKTTVSKWESGKSAPRWWMIPKVAAVLENTPDELYELMRPR